MTRCMQWQFSHYKDSPGYLKAYGDCVGRMVLAQIVLGALSFFIPSHEFLAAPLSHTIILMPIISKRVDVQKYNIFLYLHSTQGLYLHIQLCDIRVNILVTWGDHISWHQELNNSACMGKKVHCSSFQSYSSADCFWPEETLVFHAPSFNRTLQLVRQKPAGFDIIPGNWRYFLKSLSTWKWTAIYHSDLEAECFINILTKLQILPSLSAVHCFNMIHIQKDPDLQTTKQITCIDR